MISCRRLAAATLAVAYFWIGACAAPTVWENKLTFAGPSSDVFIDLEQPYPINDWGLRIKLRTKIMTKVVYLRRGDTFWDFADAAWSPDGKVLGLLVCGGSYYQFAYDFSRDAELPSAVAEQMIRSDIRSRYRLSPQKTPSNGPVLMVMKCS